MPRDFLELLFVIEKRMNESDERYEYAKFMIITRCMIMDDRWMIVTWRKENDST